VSVPAGNGKKTGYKSLPVEHSSSPAIRDLVDQKVAATKLGEAFIENLHIADDKKPGSMIRGLTSLKAANSQRGLIRSLFAPHQL
jgi:hypothetical protein